MQRCATFQQVDGCGTSLAGEKRFYRRSRCCKAHALAETVRVLGLVQNMK
jgi:SBP domain